MAKKYCNKHYCCYEAEEGCKDCEPPKPCNVTFKGKSVIRVSDVSYNVISFKVRKSRINLK